jgi:hypothetical protein
MTRKFSSPPESFGLSPLLALLPEEGSSSRLQALSSSLFARHEKVESLRGEASTKDQERRYGAEATMLKQVLEWLEVRRTGDE